jgi:hypothetical protein
MCNAARKNESSKEAKHMRIRKVLAFPNEMPQRGRNNKIGYRNAEIAYDEDKQQGSVPSKAISMRHETASQYFPYVHSSPQAINYGVAIIQLKISVLLHLQSS